MSFEYDDFFYYIQVARNIANGHGSTYNGIVLTNGYHPLWLLLLTFFFFFTQNGPSILLFVGTCAAISSVVTYFVARRILQNAGISSEPVSAALGLYVAVYACREYFTGMESILAIPLALITLGRVQEGRALDTVWSAFLTGLLASLVILARLDSVILIALLAIATLLNREYRESLSISRLLAACAGLLPLIIYLWTNEHFFSVFTPVSGMAKQLRPHDHPSWAVVQTILGANLKTRLHFLFILVSLGAALLAWRGTLDKSHIIILPALAFPAVYYAVLSFLSDWYLSDWYFYAIRISLCAAFAFWLTTPLLKRLAERPSAAVALAAIALLVVFTNWWPIPPANVYEAAVDLRQFAATHPGIYAMGDRAGKVGYILGQPLIQLEGLVMDKSYLNHLRRQENLLNVLNAYNVTYYVGTSHAHFTGCFEPIEPYQSGPSSPHLKAKFCDPPIARFQHDDIETLVYNVKEVHPY
jgi:hypothetical protein